MKGYQITFFTLQNRRHRGQPMHEWLVQQASALGIRGSTVVMAAEGNDRNGRRHSILFFELADQPLEIAMAMTENEATRFFQLLEEEKVNLFYVRTEAEFGTVGGGEREALH